MDIAAASTAMHLNQAQTGAQVSVLKKAMDARQQIAMNLIEKQAQISQSINSNNAHQGQNVNVHA